MCHTIFEHQPAERIAALITDHDSVLACLVQYVTVSHFVLRLRAMQAPAVLEVAG